MEIFKKAVTLLSKVSKLGSGTVKVEVGIRLVELKFQITSDNTGKPCIKEGTRIKVVIEKNNVFICGTSEKTLYRSIDGSVQCDMKEDLLTMISTLKVDSHGNFHEKEIKIRIKDANDNSTLGKVYLRADQLSINEETHMYLDFSSARGIKGFLGLIAETRHLSASSIQAFQSFSPTPSKPRSTVESIVACNEPLLGIIEKPCISVETSPTCENTIDNERRSMENHTLVFEGWTELKDDEINENTQLDQSKSNNSLNKNHIALINENAATNVCSGLSDIACSQVAEDESYQFRISIVDNLLVDFEQHLAQNPSIVDENRFDSNISEPVSHHPLQLMSNDRESLDTDMLEVTSCASVHSDANLHAEILEQLPVVMKDAKMLSVTIDDAQPQLDAVVIVANKLIEETKSVLITPVGPFSALIKPSRVSELRSKFEASVVTLNDPAIKMSPTRGKNSNHTQNLMGSPNMSIESSKSPIVSRESVKRLVDSFQSMSSSRPVSDAVQGTPARKFVPQAVNNYEKLISPSMSPRKARRCSSLFDDTVFISLFSRPYRPIIAPKDNKETNIANESISKANLLDPLSFLSLFSRKYRPPSSETSKDVSCTFETSECMTYDAPLGQRLVTVHNSDAIILMPSTSLSNLSLGEMPPIDDAFVSQVTNTNLQINLSEERVQDLNNTTYCEIREVNYADASWLRHNLEETSLICHEPLVFIGEALTSFLTLCRTCTEGEEEYLATGDFLELIEGDVHVSFGRTADIADLEVSTIVDDTQLLSCPSTPSRKDVTSTASESRCISPTPVVKLRTSFSGSPLRIVYGKNRNGGDCKDCIKKGGFCWRHQDQALNSLGM